MRKVATVEYKNKRGEPCEKQTYEIIGDLKVTVLYQIEPDGDKTLDSFSVAKKGTPSQRWTSNTMLEFVDGMQRVLRGEAV